MAIMRLCTLLLTTLSINSTLCCDCDEFRRFRWDFYSDTNISLEGSAYFNIHGYHIDIYNCSEFEAHWEIQRADGNIEVYTVLNDTYHYHRYEYLPDRGIELLSDCYGFCDLYLFVMPTDLRYNGAQITGVFNLPECFNSPNVTDTITLNIQGLLEAPSDVMFDIVSRDRVIVSWSPPFTLDGIPILYYIVNIISQGVVTEQINTTETLITLERPCVSTTYQISAWNDVGEGNATISELTMYEASVNSISELSKPGVCLFCTFFTDSTGDGCAVKLENDEHTFYFNTSRHNDEELIVLECFSVQEAGVYNVYVYEIQYGQVQEYTQRKLDNVAIGETQNFTLIDVIVQSISGGICVSCYFTSDSTAEGCAIQLYNDEHTFIFNISRLTNEMALLECFSVPNTGTFNVLVYETGSSNKWRLPHITTINTNAEQVRNDTTGAVTGLGTVLGLLVTGLIVGAIAVFIFFMRRNMVLKSNTEPNDPTVKSADHQQVSGLSTTTATQLYENTELPSLSASTDQDNNMYEQIELSTTTDHGKHIELSLNAAYGKVQR